MHTLFHRNTVGCYHCQLHFQCKEFYIGETERSLKTTFLSIKDPVPSTLKSPVIFTLNLQAITLIWMKSKSWTENLVGLKRSQGGNLHKGEQSYSQQGQRGGTNFQVSTNLLLLDRLTLSDERRRIVWKF